MTVALSLLPNLLPSIGLNVEKHSSYPQDALKAVPERSSLKKYRQLD